MISGSNINLTRAIIDLLSQFDKPISLDEISFRTRSSQSFVYDTLSKLEKANVVTVIGDKYKLNATEQYRLKNLVA